MMAEFIKNSVCEGVTFSYMAETRFKNSRQGVTLIVPISRETAAANALLSCVLTRS